MKQRYRVTIGIFSKVTGLLMKCISTKTFESRREARDWAIDQLDFHAPSPYLCQIDPI